eukprot:1820459-Amphidinium_carterae.1
MAGWHVSIEQSVALLASGVAANKRADLIAISPGGTSYALDVMATAEADKCRQYKVGHLGDSLPGGEKFYPL